MNNNKKTNVGIINSSKNNLPVSFDEWEDRAEESIKKDAYDYIAGGAGEEETMKENREAFKKWSIRPRVLRDVSERDLSISLLGHRLPTPLLFAPVGVQSIIHPDGELASAKAASELGIPYIVSSASSFSMEEIAEKGGPGLRWFQVYCSLEDEVTESLVKRAEASGYSAIVITVDTPMLGLREMDLKNGYSPLEEGKGFGNYISDPAFCRTLSRSPNEDKATAIQRQMEIIDKPGLDWDDINKIRKYTDLPILLKGILHPDDAQIALNYNVDGLIVSNHGGRQLDHCVSSLDALEQISDVVRGQIPVLFDSGIRRGTDVIKAIALGASAVLLGRPYVYGLVAGEEGVQQVTQQILEEIDVTMALSGIRSISEIQASLLVRKRIK